MCACICICMCLFYNWLQKGTGSYDWVNFGYLILDVWSSSFISSEEEINQVEVGGGGSLGVL